VGVKLTGDMPTNFSHANLVNVFLRSTNATKRLAAATAHRSRLNRLLVLLDLWYLMFSFSIFLILFPIHYFIRVLATEAWILCQMHAKDLIFYNISSFSAARRHAFGKFL
jgi:hypothetical protein